MALADFKFETLPRSYQIMIVVALSLVVAYIAYIYYFQPRGGDSESATTI
jgi:hypothetical protein